MWNFMTVIFRDSTSILFVALGILIMQLGGVINIGAEGMMLVGAFFGVLGTYLTGYTGFGILAALIILAVLGLLFGLMTVYWKGNQVVVGVALNLLAEGMTTTLSRQAFGSGSQSSIQGFRPVFSGVSVIYPYLRYVYIITIFTDVTAGSLLNGFFKILLFKCRPLTHKKSSFRNFF